MAGTTPVTTLEEFTLPPVRVLDPFGDYRLTRSAPIKCHFIEKIAKNGDIPRRYPKTPKTSSMVTTMASYLVVYFIEFILYLFCF